MVSSAAFMPRIEPYSLLSVVVMVSPSASVLMVFTRLVPLVTWKSTCVMTAPPATAMVTLLSPALRYIPSSSAWPAVMVMLSRLTLVVSMSVKDMLSCSTMNSM